MLDQTHQPLSIVIVYSGSIDHDYLSTYVEDENFHVVFAENDIGFCKGNNIGMKHIDPKSKYIFFLNPDAFLTPTFIENSINFMENHQECGALTGAVLGYDINENKPTGTYDSTGIFHKWYGKWYDRGQGEKIDSKLYNTTEEVPAICGAVMFCRKKALDSVLIRGEEVFDNSFFMYKEDIDLSLRLNKNDWKIMFVPNIIAYHCRGWNHKRSDVPRIMRISSARNELQIHLRHFSAFGILYSFVKYLMVLIFNL